MTDGGLKWLSESFKLCSPLNKTDIPMFKDYLNNLWTNVAMMDYPYPTTFLMPLPGNPVKVRLPCCYNSLLVLICSFLYFSKYARRCS